MLTAHAKHSKAIPSITDEQIIDDRHGRNPCMLTKIGNVAEMSSGTESCPIVHELGPKI